MSLRASVVALVAITATASALATPAADVERLLRESEEALHDRFDAAAARELVEQALVVAPGSGDAELEARALDLATTVYIFTGARTEALAAATEGLAAARRSRSAEREAWALDQLGNAQFFGGRPDLALASFEAALAAMERLGSRRGVATASKDVGIARRVAGYYDEALAPLHRAAEEFRALGERDGHVSALANLGTLYEYLGAGRLALDTYRGAALAARGSGNHELAADLHTRMGWVLLASEEPERALARFEATLALTDRVPSYRGWALMGKSSALARLGDEAGALAASDEVLAIARRGGIDADVADARRIQGYLRLPRDPVAAEADFRHALDLLEEAGPRRSWSARMGLGRALRAQGRTDEALSAYDAALAGIEQAQERLRSAATRSAFVESHQPMYREVVDALVERALPADLERAFAVLERAKARALRDAMAAAGSPPGEEAAAGGGEIRRRITRLQRELLRSGGGPAAGPLRERLEALEEQLDIATRGAPSVPSPEPPALDALRPALPHGSALLAYCITGTRVVGFLVTRDGLEVRTLPTTPAALGARVANYLELLYGTGGAAWLPVSRKLHEELVAPFSRELAAARRIVIVPDGILHLLPFETLATTSGDRATGDGAAPRLLLHDHVVSYAPSASVHLEIASRPAATAPGDILVLAAPAVARAGGSPTRELSRALYEDEGLELPALPASADEGRALVAHGGPGSRVLAGEHASESFLKRGTFAGFRVLHFATHGLASERSPHRSALLLSPGDPGEDGFLQSREILRLRMPFDLVVLSACESARGRLLAGEGVEGLVSSFLQAGSRTVVASLARIEDASARTFMDAFYARLADGLPKAEALRAAKLEMLGRAPTASPGVWSPFVLVGDPEGRVPLVRRTAPPRAAALDLAIPGALLGALLVLRRPR